MTPGEIYRHDRFYVDLETGELLRKYFVVLAILPSADFVVRLLTSKAHGRPENPRCFHGHPYPGYFLNVPGGELGAKTWVDLRHLNDVDSGDVQLLIKRGVISRSMKILPADLSALLECVAAAEDTTRRQEQAIRDLLATMR